MRTYAALLLTLMAVTGMAEDLPKIGRLVRPKDWQKTAVFEDTTRLPVKVAELPAQFDWRNCGVALPPVNSQANNDCWAQGSGGMVELLSAIHGELGNERASIQDVIDCSGAGTASGGGYWAFDRMMTQGLATAANYPYTGRDGGCRSVPRKFRVARKGNVGARGRQPTAVEIKQALLSYGPLGTTIYANSALQRWRNTDATFEACQNGGTNHIEIIVGWHTDERGRTILHVRNSWSAKHGRDGYANIPFGCSWAGTEDVTFIVLAKN